MSGLSRRLFITRSSLTVAAAGLVSALPALPAAVSTAETEAPEANQRRPTRWPAHWLLTSPIYNAARSACTPVSARSSSAIRRSPPACSTPSSSSSPERVARPAHRTAEVNHVLPPRGTTDLQGPDR
jgi:hypothetical protein